MGAHYGIIGAREKEVRANEWADFVITHQYKLLRFDKLDAYVKRYRHLSDIPTAAEAEQ